MTTAVDPGAASQLLTDLGAALGALGALGIEPNAPPRHLPDRSMIWTQPETSGGIMFQLVERH